MGRTRVVNIRKEAYDAYIGRAGPVSYTHLDVYKRQNKRVFFHTCTMF